MSRDYGIVQGTAYAGGGIGLGPGAPKPPETVYPLPEEPGHDWRPGCPRKPAVDTLRAFAEARGWSVRMTHAKGCFPHAAHGTPGPQLDSLALRMSLRGHRVVAVYKAGSTWTWTTILAWSPADFPFRLEGVTALRAHLEATAAV